MTGAELAAAAEALVGTRFRLHGRDPATGLDCVGVLAAALGGNATLPNHYALRSRCLPDLGAVVAGCGFAAFQGEVAPGDVLMVRIGPCQFHLLIAVTRTRFVHAHAGLRRVICGAAQLDWAIERQWRLTPLSPQGERGRKFSP
jgi:hypothetical protein